MKQKKICIVGFSNPEYSPYCDFYLNILKELNLEYDFIFLKRDPNISYINHNYIAIKWKYFFNISIIEKIINFIIFRFKVKKHLKINKYSHLIILTSIPSVLLCQILISKYKKKYIFDIRDYTFENIFIYFKILEKIVNNSSLNVISSENFKEFLPVNNYLSINNISINNLEYTNFCFKANTHQRIIIGYIGYISYIKNCIKIINLVLNDNRFEFHFYGKEDHPYIIKNYIYTTNNERIKYFDKFKTNDKPTIYSKIDIIFNCYGNSIKVKYALSNKLYDGLIFKKPFLTSPNTAMSNILSKYSFDIDCGLVNNLNDLYDWYLSLDGNELDKTFNYLVDESISQNKKAISEIKKILSNE